jgi:hypothetical protein
VPATRTARLSKSRFTQGIQCTRLLWWSVHEPDAPELVADASLQAVFDRGHQVGALARERFPGGVLVDGEYRDVKGKVERTRRAIADGAPAIFEASFLVDDVFVAVDVLERRRAGWNLVEVKSTTKVKDPHIPDVAVQLHVVRSSGLEVKRTDLMHLNPECTFPDLSNLFARDDVTEQAEAILPGVPGEIRRLKAALAGRLPVVEPGPHCTDPYECPFMDRCWPDLPAHHVSSLYRIGKRADAFVADGYPTIHDLPDDVRLSGPTARQMRSVREGKLLVEDGLAEALAGIEAPTAFLDFETINPAVPVWDGCHPFEAIAVQMSCHVRGARGALVHHEFLAEGPGDPRPAIADAVIAACNGARTVVAYNASFEKARLVHLAGNVPSRRKALLDVADRLVDLLPVVRDNVYHPDFGGSFGLKRVAPALVRGLGYDDLEIGEGGEAATVLEGLLLGGDAVPAAERKKLRRQLLDYCARDTLATVKLYERLVELA